MSEHEYVIEYVEGGAPLRYAIVQADGPAHALADALVEECERPDPHGACSYRITPSEDLQQITFMYAPDE